MPDPGPDSAREATAIRVCFVCLGNICRSPTAEGLFVQMVEGAGLAGRIAVDSAGTAAYHVGKPADPRSAATARGRGVALPSRARQFQRVDFDRFEYVIAMDRANREDLLRLAPDRECAARVHLLRSFEAASAPRPDGGGEDVPDPYYGGVRGFDDVFEICEAGCAGLLERIRRDHALD